MIPADVLNEASRLALAAGVKILQGFRLADTDAAHVARLLDYMQPEAGETWVDIGCGFGEVARLMHAACPDLNFILVNNNYFQLSHAPRDFLQLHADMTTCRWRTKAPMAACCCMRCAMPSRLRWRCAKPPA